MENWEKEYLQGLISEIKEFDKFVVYGFVATSKGDKSILTKMQNVDTWIIKINSLISKINISLKYAIDFENRILDDMHNPFKEDEIKDMAYYFIENAMFRTITLWDSLAQLVNCLYEFERNISNIAYRNILKDVRGNNQKYSRSLNGDEKSYYIEVTRKIKEYIEELDNTGMDIKDGFWKGNHKYINELRNRIVHRTDPHKFSIIQFGNSDDLNFPEPPLFELKRLIEDYVVVYRFINEFYKHIEACFLKTDEGRKLHEHFR